MRRHELCDDEWAIIEPLLPRKSRGVPRVDDRRVINGILWRFRTGAPWRDVPERHGPRTTLYNRFVRWRAAGVWDRLLDAMSPACDGDIVMIDSSCVPVHQHGAAAKRGAEAAELMLPVVAPGATLIADRACDTNAIRDACARKKAWADIPARVTRKDSFAFSPWVYEQRNLVERVFNRIEQFRGLATRYDRSPENFLAALKLAAIRICLATN